MSWVAMYRFPIACDSSLSVIVVYVFVPQQRMGVCIPGVELDRSHEKLDCSVVVTLQGKTVADRAPRLRLDEKKFT